MENINNLGIDAEEKLIKMLSEEISKSIDKEIIKSIRRMSSKSERINKILENIKKSNL